MKAGPDQPTLLIYNHYDVQPVDPLDKWESPPFEPTIREGSVYARGAQDNKGQCTYVLQALRALIETEGSLPINVKLCIEGEEEVGSAGLSKLLKQKETHDKLKADTLAIVDVGIRKPDIPAVTLGTRGIVTMDVEVQGTHTDLHSGSFGGLVYNPIHALVNILSKARDETGKIAIPGFYDDVKELTPEQKEQITLSFDAKEFEKTFGAKPTGGEQAFSPLERTGIRPTLEINGINGGYTGAGFKTVIPSTAHAKISCRLVPDQDPEKIGKLVARFIEQNTPDGVTVNVDLHPGVGKAVRSNPSSKSVQAFSQAYSEVFGKPTEYTFEGGSIPIVPELQQACGGEVVLLGLGLEDDNIHAPNEHFSLDRIEKGLLVISRAIQLL